MKALPMYFPNHFDLAKAKFCAELVGYAYEMYDQWKKSDSPRKESGFQWDIPSNTGLTFSSPIWSTMKSFKFLDRSEPFGFVAQDGSGNAYLVFRGTNSVSDWAQDIEVHQTEYEYVSGYGKVHNGFYELYQSLREDCLKAFAEAGGNPKTLWVTGHSLGCGISTLAVPDIANTLSFASLFHYNFASPRVGSPEFVGKYNENGILTFRVVNTCDLVTNVPLGVGLLGMLMFSHVGIPIDFTAQYSSIAGNHNLQNSYEYALAHPDNPQGPVEPD